MWFSNTHTLAAEGGGAGNAPLWYSCGGGSGIGHEWPAKTQSGWGNAPLRQTGVSETDRCTSASSMSSSTSPFLLSACFSLSSFFFFERERGSCAPPSSWSRLRRRPHPPRRRRRCLPSSASPRECTSCAPPSSWSRLRRRPPPLRLSREVPSATSGRVHACTLGLGGTEMSLSTAHNGSTQ